MLAQNLSRVAHLQLALSSSGFCFSAKSAQELPKERKVLEYVQVFLRASVNQTSLARETQNNRQKGKNEKKKNEKKKKMKSCVSGQQQLYERKIPFMRGSWKVTCTNNDRSVFAIWRAVTGCGRGCLRASKIGLVNLVVFVKSRESWRVLVMLSFRLVLLRPVCI